jgi:hypothetical protein
LAICGGFAVHQAISSHGVLAWLTSALLCGSSIYCIASILGELRFSRFEARDMKYVAGGLVVASIMATIVAQDFWEEHPSHNASVYTTNKPILPILEGVVSSDPTPYFRFIREDGTNTWFLDDVKRDFRAYSLYFPEGFAYSLIYLNPKHDISQLRPHWVELVRCEEFDQRALDLLGIKYAFCRDRTSGPTALPGWERVGTEYEQSLFRRLNYDGGIKLLHQWRIVPPEPPLSARREVLAAAAQGVALLASDPGIKQSVAEPYTPRSRDQIDLVVDQPGQIQLDVTTERSGVLLIPDNYHSGWRASVNGHHIRPLKVFHAYLGVPVEPGRSVIDLEFRDIYFLIGSVISVVTMFGLILYVGLQSSRSYVKCATKI